MIISERIFKILEEKNMMQKDFAKQAGIANSTVSDWKRKKTNPSADKIMDICMVLDVTPEQLLTGKGIDENASNVHGEEIKVLTPVDIGIIESFHSMQDSQKKRLLAYIEALKKLEHLENI